MTGAPPECPLDSAPAHWLPDSPPAHCLPDSPPAHCLLDSPPAHCLLDSPPAHCLPDSPPAKCMLKRSGSMVADVMITLRSGRLGSSRRRYPRMKSTLRLRSFASSMIRVS